MPSVSLIYTLGDRLLAQRAIYALLQSWKISRCYLLLTPLQLVHEDRSS